MNSVSSKILAEHIDNMAENKVIFLTDIISFRKNFYQIGMNPKKTQKRPYFKKLLDEN